MTEICRFSQWRNEPSTSSLRLGIRHGDENWISIIYDTFIYCDSRASYLLIWILKSYNENKIFVVLLDLRQTARPESSDDDELCAVIYSSPLQPPLPAVARLERTNDRLVPEALPKSSKNKKALKCKFAELFLWLFCFSHGRVRSWWRNLHRNPFSCLVRPAPLDTSREAKKKPSPHSNIEAES